MTDANFSSDSTQKKHEQNTKRNLKNSKLIVRSKMNSTISKDIHLLISSLLSRMKHFTAILASSCEEIFGLYYSLLSLIWFGWFLFIERIKNPKLHKTY